MRKLSIAILTGKFPCISETFILNQIIYLLDQGHHIDIYANEKDFEPVHPAIINYKLLDRTKYYSFPKSRWIRFKTFLLLLFKSRKRFLILKTVNIFKYGRSALSLHVFYKCLTFLDAPKYDIVHAHFGSIGNDAVLVKEAGFLVETPLITTFHGIDINPKLTELYKKAYRKLFEYSCLITYNSNFTCKLLKEASCPEEKLVKLPVSLDTTFFKKRNVLAKKGLNINIVFCGRFVEFKAPDLVIDIANEIINKKRYTNVKFHLIGGGLLQQHIEEKILEFRLSDSIFLYGSLVQEEIIELLSTMDIFLYPGVYDIVTGRVENQGLVLQEAQALELPVVTSNVGGIPEGVLDKETGFIVQERNISEFVEKTEVLIKDATLRTEMGKTGRKYVKNNFDNKILCKKLEDYYYKVKMP